MIAERIERIAFGRSIVILAQLRSVCIRDTNSFHPTMMPR